MTLAELNNLEALRRIVELDRRVYESRRCELEARAQQFGVRLRAEG